MNTLDPYKLTEAQIQDPPRTLRERLRFVGPGFILSASIVGSGELVATTTLGAQAGFVTFWVVLISCLVKVAVQVEFAKHTILSGRTSMQLIAGLPGPKFRKGRWSLWLMFLLTLLKFLQMGGIVGGVAIVLHMILPAGATVTWSWVVALVASILVFRGYYSQVERFSMFMIGFFTLFTFLSLYFVQYTNYAFTWSEVTSGLMFNLPPALVAIAIGAFGITGVAGDEIIFYNYWCLEKGYARFTGPDDGSENWTQRAKGWIRTMHVDAIVAMCVYTLVTALFYLLGASVLHAQGVIPQGYQSIEVLSNMYTETLGSDARGVFLAGAFVVLFSTLFASLAAWSRLISDLFGQLKWIDFNDLSLRRRTVALAAWILPISWAALFAWIKLPVIMILSGGLSGAVILFLIVYATGHLRYKTPDQRVVPGLIYDVILWMSMLSIVAVGIYGIVKLL